VSGVFVLDSFALLAYFEDEAGAERVQRILAQAEKGRASLAMSLINWGEVLYALQRSRGETGRNAAVSVIDQLPISLIAPDRAQTVAAAGLKARHPIAYADCFAAALAIARKARLVTGDPEFRRLEKDIPIDWLAR
jgi:ribonuclease VapC